MSSTRRLNDLRMEALLARETQVVFHVVDAEGADS
jgi:hypothetical protein